MQAKAITRELRKREREGQAGTSQNPKPQNNPMKKQDEVDVVAIHLSRP